MKESKAFQEELITMLEHLGFFWMFLSDPGKVIGKTKNYKISAIHPAFARNLGIKKNELINEDLNTLRNGSMNEQISLFISNINNSGKNQFILEGLKQNYQIRKHFIANGLLVTAKTVTKEDRNIDYPIIEKKFHSIFNALGDFVFINAFNGKFLEVNDTALKILSFSKKEFLKLTPRDVSVSRTPDSGEISTSAFDQYDEWAQSEQLLFGAELLTRHGKRIPIEARSKVINYDGSEAILTIARDITERVMFEKRLLNIVMETEEKERRRLSEELHDGLGPLLSSVKLHTDMLINGKLDNTKKDKVARIIKELVSESINNIREISANLMPHVLSNYGLISALNILISKVTALQSIEVKFEHISWNTRKDISIEILIYRVVSELLTNTLKHASAKNIYLSLSSNAALLEIVYKDDGIGFDSREKLALQSGMGLNNILNRIKSQQGSVRLQTAPGKGLTVLLKLPVEL